MKTRVFVRPCSAFCKVFGAAGAETPVNQVWGARPRWRCSVSFVVPGAENAETLRFEVYQGWSKWIGFCKPFGFLCWIDAWAVGAMCGNVWSN